VLSNKCLDATLVCDLEVVVGDIIDAKGHKFVVTYIVNDGALPKGTSITFSMKYWEEETEPQKGQVLIVGKVQKFVKGWRAFEAHPVTPVTSKVR
jgi:hypothetical protein